MSDRKTFWFPAKRYGWGWGLPVRWQGWVVLAGYFALLFVGLQFFRPRTDVRGLLIYMALLTVVFIAIIVAKGEKPLRWRWGRDRSQDAP